MLSFRLLLLSSIIVLAAWLAHEEIADFFEKELSTIKNSGKEEK